MIEKPANILHSLSSSFPQTTFLLHYLEIDSWFSTLTETHLVFPPLTSEIEFQNGGRQGGGAEERKQVVAQVKDEERGEADEGFVGHLCGGNRLHNDDDDNTNNNNNDSSSSSNNNN